jgi:HSP20 family molecular chaperone IbpA
MKIGFLLLRGRAHLQRLGHAFDALDRRPRWPHLLNIETSDRYVLEVELPGVRPDEVRIDLRGRELLISRSPQHPDERLDRGRSLGPDREFRYFVTLSQAVNPAGAFATWRDTRLTVRVPKGTAEGPNWVQIDAHRE